MGANVLIALVTLATIGIVQKFWTERATLFDVFKKGPQHHWFWPFAGLIVTGIILMMIFIHAIFYLLATKNS